MASAGRRLTRALTPTIRKFNPGGHDFALNLTPTGPPGLVPANMRDEAIKKGDQWTQQGDYDPVKIENDASVNAAKAEEARKQALRDQVGTMFANPDPEEAGVSGALRANYGDELKQKYGDAERALRFGAARTGNIGSTNMADEEARLSRENQLGGANIEGAVRRAVGGLRTAREDTRARGIGLINSGQGAEGVTSATEGLRLASENARNANREQLFNDLFQNIAYNRALQSNGTLNLQALLAAQGVRGSGGGGGGVYFNTNPRRG